MLASSTFSPRRIVIHSPLVSSILRKPSSPQSTLSSSLPVRTSRVLYSRKNATLSSSPTHFYSLGLKLASFSRRSVHLRHYSGHRRCRRHGTTHRPLVSLWTYGDNFIRNDAFDASNNFLVVREYSSSTDNEPTSKSTASKSKGKHVEESVNDTASTSSPSSTWVDTRLPTSLQPYAKLARMDKPIGTMLLLWPCFWSTAIAAPAGSLPDLKLLGLFTVGSFVMRGAGCTINDMWDSDFDKSVSRTKTRPLASGELTHHQASKFLLAQLTTGLGVLLSLPHLEYCFVLGASSLPLVFSYPLMKRYTNWPQLVLGLTFNWGAFMGWAATHGSLDYSVVLPLYASGVTWTLVYDTLYAHQDKKDDAKLGLKSTALHFGDNTKPILHAFSTFTFANWLMVGNQLGYDSWMYYGGCGLAYSHLLWQVHTAKLNEKEGDDNLGSRFRSNSHVGALVFVSCVAGNVMATV
uniref:4-hydroxybenzoate polyprenyltransferase, mitochondrial n=1 Tax=Ditylum brightwellii TaxID=49249 RepID=A0A6U3UIB2_9STRA|mmetsp:Transcript_11307/g.16843  ORF Transcript_11307/g.16843 Transcript_11307/m.16843 type:complete len:464 (+) Transcript_11307:168-1559(+)